MSKDKPGSQYKDSINLPKTDFAMKAGLVNKEPRILEKWASLDAYHSLLEQRRDAPLFTLHDGPPYANGNIHTGHAMQKILKDIVVKSKNLAGFRAPFIPGWDCHGLPIEIQVEKKHGKAGQKIDKKTFRQKCREYAATQVELQKKDFKRLGIQGDWESPYLTMDFNTEADTVRSLAKIVESGHLYHGLMPVYWCPACASALAEAEVEYQDKVSPAIDVKFVVSDEKDFAQRVGVSEQDLRSPSLVIWTTTPWTLPANEAVALHAELDYVLVNAGEHQLVLAQDLVSSALERYELDEDSAIVASFKGEALEHLQLRHPFYAKKVPVILGDHVTTDAGTGAVHTAPAHGAEDFAVGKLYDLPVNNPVGATGTYLDSTEIFAGQFVFKANAEVVKELDARGVLLKHEDYQHSYPHCWRHKTPMIYRATAQWFIGMERKPGKQGLRALALEAIKTVNWEPKWGEARINTMVEGRPDWCISRQRNWGVPIAVFLHKESGELHPDTPALMEKVAIMIEAQGIQAWYDLETSEMLGDDAEHYDKVLDTLDVWFDSGVTHNSVVNARSELRFPSDLYLEGSDQHRGWFQSSLLSSVAMNNGQAPYKTVLTHGFVVDKDGRKMSKSLGNVIAPQEVINSLGADILRLWVAGTDYKAEVTLSQEVLQRTGDTYRRIRNTIRYLLGNLHGFDARQHSLPFEEMLSLDQWAVRLVKQLQIDIENAYETYQFHNVYQKLHQFCVVEMGGFSLDVIKDRLYTMPAESRGRLSAQTAMNHILETLVRVITPVLSFTAEEVWEHMQDRDLDSVLFATRYEELDQIPANAQADEVWEIVLTVREQVAKQIEELRTAGKIGAALDATVVLYADGDIHAALSSIESELKFAFISSAARLEPLAAAAEDAKSTDINGLQLAVVRVDDEKCVRCWHRQPEVGSIEAHPELCSRCVENIDGDGESRLYI